MSDHLSPEVLTALADGELDATDLSAAKAHLDRCLECASRAISEWVMKPAVAKAGQRYEAPTEFRDRMVDMIAREATDMDRRAKGAQSPSRNRAWGAISGWALAGVLILALGGWGIIQHRANNIDSTRSERAALIAEACDQHIALLASSQPPQVVSSDRHTVKPWFQGKLPFSFNIPESLPADTTLEGANLAYLHNHPVAQLLFSIGRHRVSVFVEEKGSAAPLAQINTSHSGFDVIGFNADELEFVAVSDVDPSRLEALANDLRGAQMHQ